MVYLFQFFSYKFRRSRKSIIHLSELRLIVACNGLVLRSIMHFAFCEYQVLDKEPFQKQMLEKLIWICAFMLVGARHPGATVGAVEKEYRSEVSDSSMKLFEKYPLLIAF